MFCKLYIFVKGLPWMSIFFFTRKSTWEGGGEVLNKSGPSQRARH